jgi:hypothetical protein
LGYELDNCEFANPGMRVEYSGGTAYKFSSEQGERIRKIQRFKVR